MSDPSNIIKFMRSPEGRESARQRMLQLHKDPVLKSKMVARHKENILKANHSQSEERRKASSERLKKRWEDPEFVAKLRESKRSFRGRNGKTYNHNGVMMRSSWEVKFAQMCDERGIKWQYEPKFFRLGKDGVYMPDFFLPDLRIWVEVKPYKYFEHGYNKAMGFPHVLRLLDINDFDKFFEGGIMVGKIYQKIPVNIDAIQFDGTYESALSVKEFTQGKCTFDETTGTGMVKEMKIHTLEGVMTVIPTDFVIKGVEGEFYNCKEKIFHRTYKEVQ